MMGNSRNLADLLNNSGDLTVDTDTLHVDATNNRVGVGTATPSEPFHIKGASGAATDMQIQGGDDTNSVRLFMGGSTNPLNGRIVYSTASDFMAFSTGGDQRIRVDSDGLKFGSDTAATNALSDYEEGTWTPTVEVGTASVSDARYVKVGQLVTLMGNIYNLSDRTSGNHFKIGGIPFDIHASATGATGVMGRYINNGGDAIVLYAGSNANKFAMYTTAVGADYTGIGHNDINSASFYLYFTITYITDA